MLPQEIKPTSVCCQNSYMDETYFWKALEDHHHKNNTGEEEVPTKAERSKMFGNIYIFQCAFFSPIFKTKFEDNLMSCFKSHIVCF